MNVRSTVGRSLLEKIYTIEKLLQFVLARDITEVCRFVEQYSPEMRGPHFFWVDAASFFDCRFVVMFDGVETAWP